MDGVYTILLILVVVLIYYGGRLIPEDIKVRWENSRIKKWSYPTFTVLITVAVAMGIKFDILNWAAVVFPILFGFPYILGMVLGIWYRMKDEGSKVIYKRETTPKEIAVNSLVELGCKPEVNKDGHLEVCYQGENFIMEFEGMYVRLWDPMWSGIRADDPATPQIREAVNVANFNFGPTVIMSEPDEEGIIGFHSRMDIMLHPSCPDNVVFLKAILDSFFATKESVRRHFKQINSQQQQAATRRPVGFATQK